jgi:hypothetical protein
MSNTHPNLGLRGGTHRDFVASARRTWFCGRRGKKEREEGSDTALVLILKAMTCLPREDRAHAAFGHIGPLKIILAFITLIWKHQIYGNSKRDLQIILEFITLMFSNYGDVQLLFWSLTQKSFLQLFKFRTPKVERFAFFIS